MTAGHWAELLEFEVEVPVLELNASDLPLDALADEVEAWVSNGFPARAVKDLAVEAVDWLGESLD